MTGRFSGRNCLVTGGTRGIGAAIAERLRDEGGTIIATGSSAGSTPPDDCAFRVVDFANRAATQAFADELAEAEIDVLVNNAGVNKVAPFAQIDPDDFDWVQTVNLRAPFLLSRAVVSGMAARGWGRIVNIASIFSVQSKAQRGSYSASKFALDGLTAALAAEVAADGVLVNCVSPGFIDTELTRVILGDVGIAELVARIPVGRLGRPTEVASLVAWLASPENTYVSGQNFLVDGGFARA